MAIATVVTLLGAYASPAAATRASDVGSLSGRFVTAAGEPVANAKVEVRAVDWFFRGTANTDADGAFRFDDLETGAYQLLFTSPDGVVQWAHQKTQFLSAEAETFTVNADQDTVVTETALPVGSLEVRVYDAQTGHVVSNACVTGYRSGPQEISGCTDHNGRARIAAPAGTYSFGMGSEGYLSDPNEDEIVVSVGRTTVVTRYLTREAVFEVSVEDARTHQPVDLACVALVPDGEVVGDNQDCSGPDGKIRAGHLSAGEFRIYAFTRHRNLGAQWVGESGGTGDLRQAKVFTAIPGRTTNVSVKLDPAGSITGIVRAANGTPAENVCPSTIPVGTAANMNHTVCTGTDGSYTLRGIGPYQWPVVFADFSGTHAWMWSGNAADRFDATPVAVQAGRSTRADATLSLAGGRLAGKVLDPTISAHSIVVRNTRTGDIAGSASRVTNEFDYTIHGINTQNVWVTYYSRQAGTVRHPDPVAVTAGQTTYLDLPAPN